MKLRMRLQLHWGRHNVNLRQSKSC